jgi:hypothetical protein
MKNYTKVPKHVEEKMMNTEKKKSRSQQRDKKHVAWDDAIVVEEPPQVESEKEFEEGFKLWKRTQNPKDPLYQPRVPKEQANVVTVALQELALDIVEPSKESEEECEYDGDDWFE